MTIYRLELSYDGTDFYGWQKQPNVQSVQESLENCIKKIIKQDNVKSMGSGRTDAGVHAKKQVVRLEIPVSIEAEKLRRALNQNLSKSIRVNKIEVSEEFHPTRDVKIKNYRYYFSMNELCPSLSRYVLYLDRIVDIEEMEKGARLFIGRHSFHNYFCVGTPVKSFEREIISCEIVPTTLESQFGSKVECYYLEIKGTGFLKQMVRLIFGSLHFLGLKKITVPMIQESLNKTSDQKLAPVAPPQGLILYDVTY